MELNKLKDILNEYDLKNIILPKQSIFVISDFKKEVPKNMHKMRKVEFNHGNQKVNIIDEDWYNSLIKRKL